jgi:Short C-terminal domain
MPYLAFTSIFRPAQVAFRRSHTSGGIPLQQLTEQGRQRIDELAQRYSVSTDAVVTLLQSLVDGNGTMAQFNHRELGGGGQWMRGGMTMVGDMFNHGLKAKVEGVCSELSQLLAQQPFVPFPASFQSQSQGGHRQQGSRVGAGSVSLFVPEAPGRASGQWWPVELGLPNGSGGQNQVRYAYFNPTRRLAVELNGHVTVYDSLDHQISGVSQQQGGGGSLTFTSQYGTVSVSSLPIVSVDDAPGNAPEPRRPASPSNLEADRAETAREIDIFAKIERLAELQQKGIVSPEEFAAKKAELLSRL